MSDEQEPNYWFVGAARGATQDKTDELLNDGVWRFWPDPDKPDQYRDQILAMRPGDKIAIKSSYVRKRNLPFDNKGKPVSVMAIKAIGEVSDNPGDGETVNVDWHERFDPPREWYFYTGRISVWKPDMQRWYARALVAFAFDGEEQDIDAFRNEPYWRDRYGDTEQTDSRFAWTSFYQAFASRLLDFEERRDELIAGLKELSEAGQVPTLGYFFEKDAQGNRWFLEDICPFTFMGAFNRGATDENRRAVAAALARIIDLDRPVPEAFEGIPVLNNQRSWFFAYQVKRRTGDIDRLWALFREALWYADAAEDDAALSQALTERYDEVLAQRGVGWNLTIGLYWVRPWTFLPLDHYTRSYLQDRFGISLPGSHQYQKFSGESYLALLEELAVKFEEEDSPVKSFPELSLAAWTAEDASTALQEGGHHVFVDAQSHEEPPDPYSVDDVVAEGCFFPRAQIERMIHRLEQKKNLILQGAPGTGKTWLSKKLAYALMGFRSESNLIPLQFHPTLSYEDFVRGWRPSAGGVLDLVDGPFMQAIHLAKDNPESRIVVVIEEINRGNPAQIFGEMLTLLEGDKRGREHGMRLSHMHDGERNVFVPPNLYVIGTMNLADRSLALVDLALRRRFAFFDLEPQFNDAWLSWVVQNGWFKEERVREIQTRMRALNDVIENDEALGPQFRVGHSYVTPRAGGEIRSDAKRWFSDIVHTEIRPLLEEYWFDRPDQAREQAEKLLEGW